MKYEKYIGTKIISASPMKRGEYNKYRGWNIPENENPEDEGYFLIYSDGYESWSPKKQFEDDYRKSGSMNFGHALELLKSGEKVARKGWNSKDMFLFLTHGEDLTTCICREDTPPCVDSICMKTAENRIVIGWIPTQADMFAEDWEIINY